MLYNSQNPIDQERAQRKLKELLSKNCVFELTEKKAKRTLLQNNYLHLILTYFAIETGYTIDWVKREYFKRYCNPAIFIQKKEGAFGIVEGLRSSADLDTMEMTTAIERFRNISSQESGIYLPTPNEHLFLQEIELEAQRHKEFL